VIRRIGKAWFSRTRHPSDEELLRFLDGETDARAAKKIRRHLDACWACRARRRKFERAIALFVDHRPAKAEAGANPPPKGWREFDIRLAQLAAEETARPETPRRTGFSWRVAGVLAAGLAIVLLAPEFTVKMSAKELLLAAVNHELWSVKRQPEPVVHERLLVSCSPPLAGESSPVAIESWSDLGRNQTKRNGSPEAWRELDRILRANSMTEVLSASSFHGWWKARASGRGEVSKIRLAGGREGWLLKTGPAPADGPGEIISAEFVVLVSDWSPVRLTLRLRSAPGTRECTFRREGYELLARNHLGADVFGAAPEKPAAELPPPPKPAAIGASAPDITRQEVKALYALHRAGECETGALEIHRDSSGLVLGGVVAGKPEEARVREAVAGLSLLKVELSQAGPGEIPPASRTAADAGEPVTEPAAPGQMPIEPELRRVLEAGHSSDDLDAEVAGFSNQAIGLSLDCWREAWALRRLAKRYEGGSLAELDRTSRWLVEVMIRDHLTSLRSSLAELAALLRPLGIVSTATGDVAPARPEADWTAASAGLLDAMVRMDDEVRRLFSIASGPPTGAGEAGSIESLREKLPVAAVELDWFQRRSTAALAGNPAPRVEPATAAARRQ